MGDGVDMEDVIVAMQNATLTAITTICLYIVEIYISIVMQGKREIRIWISVWSRGQGG